MNADDDQSPGQPISDAQFGAAWALDSDQATAALSGELDVTCADRFYTVLDTVRRDGYRHIELALPELAFLSASGAGVLAHAAEDYTRAGGSFALSQPTPMVARVLELTGLQHLITTAPDTTQRGTGRHAHTLVMDDSPDDTATHNTGPDNNGNGHRPPHA